MLLPIHIAAGALAIVLGAVALSVRKGGTIHRRSGMLFVWAMIVMGVTASMLEFVRSAAATNLAAAILSIYFVGTALTAVRPASRWTRVINVGALTVALGLALVLIVGGVKGINNPGLSPGGVPFRTIGVMSLVLAAFLLLAAAGDVRVIRHGLPRGGPRVHSANSVRRSRGDEATHEYGPVRRRRSGLPRERRGGVRRERGNVGAHRAGV